MKSVQKKYKSFGINGCWICIGAQQMVSNSAERWNRRPGTPAEARIRKTVAPRAQCERATVIRTYPEDDGLDARCEWKPSVEENTRRTHKMCLIATHEELARAEIKPQKLNELYFITSEIDKQKVFSSFARENSFLCMQEQFFCTVYSSSHGLLLVISSQSKHYW